MFRDSIEDIRDYGQRRGWRAEEKGVFLTMRKGSRVLTVTFSANGRVTAARLDGSDITGAGKTAKIRKALES